MRHMLGDMVNLTSEIQMLERAQGHGVIQLLGCAILPTEAFLYLELCEGDLKGQVWREDALAPMVAQPRDAVCHIHKLHIIHMDIKPANILVKSGKPVLSDFGRACLEADVSAARVRLTRWHSPIPPAGTSCWRAPRQPAWMCGLSASHAGSY